jgi:Stress responsive A/B Barrel Domain
MPIRHCVVFKFAEDTSEEQVLALSEGLARLPGVIDSLTTYSFGGDIGENETSWDFAVVADCDDLDGYREYRDHPEHRRLIRELVEPIVAERRSVQFAMPG